MKLVNLLEAGLQVGDKVWHNDLQAWQTVTEIDERLGYPISTGSNNLKRSFTVKGAVLPDVFPVIMLDKPDWELPTKKPEPDWAKIFTLDKPFMVRDSECESWELRYALKYKPDGIGDFKVFSDGWNSDTATEISFFNYARELTLEERKEYLCTN